jgi:hypothetical protein
MDFEQELKLMLTRRQFFARSSTGIGVAALASLLSPEAFAGGSETNLKTGGLPDLPHFAPKAKRVIFLHQSGAPSQIELSISNPNSQSFRAQSCPTPSAWASGSRA